MSCLPQADAQIYKKKTNSTKQSLKNVILLMTLATRLVIAGVAETTISPHFSKNFAKT